jgi:amino acid adenylation domain-containing protein
VPVLLTQQRLLGALPPHPARVLCLDSDSEAIARESDAGLASGATANGLAYVIYTSGSSGRPKGVLVTHRNVTRLFAATRAWFHFGESDVWTLFHSYAFDFSVWELWGALLHGGRLVVVPYWVSRSPETFYDLLAAERVTILNQTPSAFRQLVRAEEGKGRGDLALRLVVFGGEALEPQSLRPWFDRHPDDAPRLVNMYGITETTVHVTYRPLAAVDAVGSGSVIGRPLPDLQLYLLDRHLQPVPIGVPGEMYVGGAGLARGYLNRPELTAVRFLPNPFAGGQGSLYKSGDLARYLPNGDVEYLGRIDDQVKIRGFRVEPGEIAAVLTGCPGVREAVVVVRQEVSGEKRLAAYAVPAKGEAITVAGLRHYLKEKLPEYMLPAAVVLLDALPLTANGKLDRRALPAPDWSGATGQAYVPPRTPLEEAIAGIWSEVLGLPRVGIHDSFFDLGGHSLLATQIVSRLRQALGVELSLRCLFEAPTIADLAPAVAESRRGPQEPHALRRIHRHDAQGALARVDKLAEDEVDSWLGKMLDEGEGQE